MVININNKSYIRRLLQISREEGVTQACKKSIEFLYQSVRPLLPKKRRVIYSGNKIDKWHYYIDRLFPRVVEWEDAQDRPRYESGIIEGLREHVEPEDTVVIVGGGYGVSAVVAAKQAGPQGSVIVFEGAKESAERVRSTASLNEVSETVSVRHAIVSHANFLRGETRGEIVAPTNLPACDVLELDCEGAELDILSEIQIGPRALIVETHGMYDSPSSAVREKIEAYGYEVVSKEVADEGQRQTCLEKDIYVLSAIESDGA